METIRGIGHLEVQSDITDQAGARITSDFLSKLVTGFLKCSKLNIKNGLPACFSYREMQLNASFAPAIYQFADAFLMEYPLYKEDRIKNALQIDSFRRIDYWIFYRNTDIYLELKHIRIPYYKAMRKDVKPLWEEVIRQAERAKDRARSEATGGARGAISIAFHLLTIFHGTKSKADDKSVVYTQKRLSEIFNEYKNELDPRPDWSALIRFNERFIKASRSELDKGFEYYPGLMFMAHVTDLVNFERHE